MKFAFPAELSGTSGSGGKFFGLQCDMEQDAEIRNMFDWIRNNPELGQVDVCICNAGLEQLWLLHGPYFDGVA